MKLVIILSIIMLNRDELAQHMSIIEINSEKLFLFF